MSMNEAMRDLVERLRNHNELLEHSEPLCDEAADAIESLQPVVDAARVERQWHQRSYGGPCNCAMCDALRTLDGDK